MRIGFDVSQTGASKAGCGYFADSLIQHLAQIDTRNEYILYPTFGEYFWDPDWRRSTREINQPNFARGLGHTSFEAARLFWRNPPLDFATQLGGPEIIHSNNFYCPRAPESVRLVYTLHDLAFLEHPEWTTEENRVCCFGGVFDASQHADFVIAVSDYTRRDFLKTFPHYPADRVVVIYEASRLSPQRELDRPRHLPPSLQPDHFWLNVGILEPRKNHVRLLRAYAKLKARVAEPLPLVLAGGSGWLMDGFEDVVKDLGLANDVVMLGYVDDTTLRWLYQNCFAFVFPSLFEGFGLPVVEAMTLGAPVICSDNTSLPEIVGSAGLLVDPYDEDEIFRAMLKLSRGEVSRQALKDKGRGQAARFSWTGTAEEILHEYQEVAAQPRLCARQRPSRPSDVWM